MIRTYRQLLLLVLLLAFATFARAQTITVASYNIERFAERFEGHHASTQPIAKDPAVKQLISDMQKDNDKSNWEAAQVIKQLKPDILVIVEGPEQEDLDYFNRRWMDGFFKTDVVFPTNTTRHQTLCLLVRPGFKIVQKRDQYYLENDTVPNPRGER